MTKVGLITVGQAPRSDVVPDMAAILGGDVEIAEAGALDGLTLPLIASLAPEGDDEILVTRLADGSSVFIGKTKMIPAIIHLARRESWKEKFMWRNLPRTLRAYKG